MSRCSRGTAHVEPPPDGPTRTTEDDNDLIRSESGALPHPDSAGVPLGPIPACKERVPARARFEILKAERLDSKVDSETLASEPNQIPADA